MRKIVSSPQEAAANIRRFAEEVGRSPELQSKLGQVHAWYALRLPGGSWAFGSSKFVGYQNNSARKYLDTYQTNADGRETEQALGRMSQEVDSTSRLGRELTRALEEFLHQWGRKSRIGARIRVISEEPELAIVPKHNTENSLLSRISSDPDICGGRPCIKGTRMRVADIVEALAHGATQEELLGDFDYLTTEDIAAALLYSARASDHRVVHTA